VSLAAAKVNLVLRVGPLRPDGYHELASLVAALDVGDRIDLEPAPETVVEAPGLPGGDTLVTRALTLLAARAGARSGWRVRVAKQIPPGAGLGGGSADAGVALRLANATLAAPLPADELVALAAGVGSDVPFFASGLTAARAYGRGERLSAAALPEGVVVALAWPGEHVSTADVYRAYQAPQLLSTTSVERAAAAADLATLAAHCANDLQEAAEQLCPASGLLRRELVARGAAAAAVSGSGSAVFGLFGRRGEAEAALEGLPGAAWSAVARPLP
jgi:4-diphosphocytidyl-2-C-methyl-D-erythritol kinase